MAKMPLISGKIQYFKDRLPFNVRQGRDNKRGTLPILAHQALVRPTLETSTEPHAILQRHKKAGCTSLAPVVTPDNRDVYTKNGTC